MTEPERVIWVHQSQLEHEPQGSQAEAEPPNPSFGRRVWEWVRLIVLAVLVGYLLTTYVIQRNTVSGSSMYPTLYEGDELIVQKVSKWFHDPTRGTIITLHVKASDLRGGEANIIKRVIGVPGDHVVIKENKVFVNDRALDEPYLLAGTVTTPGDERYSDVTLADDAFYVLGDNRGVSLDSRRFGPVTRSEIMGAVLIRVWPLPRVGTP